MKVSTGASFVSVTVILIVSFVLAPMPSSTVKTMPAYVPGPWASVGVQLKAPVAASIAAPAGAPAPSE